MLTSTELEDMIWARVNHQLQHPKKNTGKAKVKHWAAFIAHM